MTVPHPNQAMPHQEHNLTLSVWERSTWIRFFVCATIADHEHGMPRRARTMGSSWLAGWLHGVFVGDWLFVFPLCGFSLSLFCNCSGSRAPPVRAPARSKLVAHSACITARMRTRLDSHDGPLSV